MFYICFTIGYFGFGEFVPAPEASIAATAPLLLSMYVGSALVNGLNRIQGLMLGNVEARLLGGFVDSCSIEDLILHYHLLSRSLGLLDVFSFPSILVLSPPGF